ncbi:MAG: fatty acid desaturase [Alphaproteobacteria bacterium]
MSPAKDARPDTDGRGATGLDTAAFQKPLAGTAIVQAATTFGGLIATLAAMYVVAAHAWWLALPLAPLAAGFLVRLFIIQHDCGHRSFFATRRANDIMGFACSLATMTPYASWRRQHAGHHTMWNNLDRRDTGVDIYSTCLTVAEYHALPRWRRLGYRVSRNPIVTNLLLPPLIFTLLYRLPFDTPKAQRRERRSVFVTNLALIALFGGLGLALGFGEVLAVQLPVIALAAIIGVWLFSVQHKAERTLWAREAAWTRETAALLGSTWLRLPRVLQWFTGSIGLHHLHHLNPRIPNYRLQRCCEAIPALRQAPSLSLRGGLAAMRYALWDEGLQRMVTFRAAGRAAA